MKYRHALVTLSSITLAFDASVALSRSTSQLSPSGQGVCQEPNGATFVKGVIPDIATASRVSLDILYAIYGHELINLQLPLRITLEKDHYVIEGVRRRGEIGGNASMILCKKNGAVLFLSHSK